MAMTKRKGPDTLDKTVTYLAKRDGIDKARASASCKLDFERNWLEVCRTLPLTIRHDLGFFMLRIAIQVLKVIRYSTKFALATAFKNDSSDLAIRLQEFESSIGTSR